MKSGASLRGAKVLKTCLNYSRRPILKAQLIADHSSILHNPLKDTPYKAGPIRDAASRVSEHYPSWKENTLLITKPNSTLVNVGYIGKLRQLR